MAYTGTNPETGNPWGGSGTSGGGGSSSGGSSNVVPSGRYTKEGEVIWERAKTETDIKREASAQRVQKFSSGGRKISDTQRVEVTVGGEKKWVTPEKALEISKEKSKIEEAKKKIEKKRELEQTIRAKYEQEIRRRITPTTREQFIEHLAKKQGKTKEEILRAEKKEGFPASKKFIELYEKRKPEIKRVLEREAGLEAWREEREKREKEFEEERAEIEPMREIWQMKPSLEKAKKYYKAWLTKPKEFELARAELLTEAKYAEDKKAKYMLSSARGFTYARQHPIKTAVVIGALSVPILGLGSKLPIVGKVVSSKALTYGFATAYGVARGYEYGAKVRREPKIYKDPSAIIEVGSEMALEVTAFTIGAKAASGIIAAPKRISTKIKETRLTKAVKGRTVSKAKEIILAQRDVGPKKDFSPAKTTKEVSTKLRVKDLKGFKAVREIKAGKGKLKAVVKYKPVYSKSYLIELKDIQQPEAMIIRTQAERIGVVAPKKVTVKIKGGELIKGSGVYQIDKGGRFLATQKQVAKLSQKVIYKAELDIDPKIQFRERGFVKGIFEPTSLQTFEGKVRKIEYQKPIPKGKGIRLLYDLTAKQIGYTAKLEAPEVIYKPVITEAGEALGTYKIDLKKGTIDFITAGRGKPRYTKPFKDIVAKPPEPETGIEVPAGPGQVTILKQKYKVVEGVKLKSQVSKLKTSTALVSPKPKLKTESKIKTDLKEEYKVKEEILSKNIFSPISDVAGQGVFSKLRSAVIPKSKQASILDTKIISATAQDIAQAQAQAQAQELIPKQVKEIKILRGIDNIFDTGKGKPRDKLRTGLPLISRKEKEEGLEQYKVSVRRRGLFRPIGIVRGAARAFLLGKKEVGRTAAASFKVEPLHGLEDLSRVAARILPRHIFRRSKVDRDIFVERREKRIKSPGEKREITRKGLWTLKQKGSKKRRGFNLFGR